jgi:C-terminal processing protease CtpA/Prc
VAKYYGPDGKAISDNGVTPSVVQPASGDADNPDDEGQPEEPERFGGKDDLQLRKAIEILNQAATAPKAA